MVGRACLGRKLVALDLVGPPRRITSGANKSRAGAAVAASSYVTVSTGRSGRGADGSAEQVAKP